MSRNGSGVYSLPAGSTVTNGDTSDATDLNTPLADLEADANLPRPIVAGGTGASSAAQALINLGLTATAAEINVLDGVTASTAELNILDGVTATTAEINHIDGVTSPIQTQINAKLTNPMTTDGDIITRASGVAARLALGTAYQTPRVNAGGTALEYAAGPRVLLASKTASASATLDFTEFNNAVFRYYEFELEDVKPATDAVDLVMRTSTNGGSSYDAGASDYNYVGIGAVISGAATVGSAGAATLIPLTFTGAIGNAANEKGVSGTVKMFNAGTATHTRVMVDVTWDNPSSLNGMVNLTGKRAADQDTDAVRFLMTSGNIASGTIRMYGVP